MTWRKFILFWLILAGIMINSPGYSQNFTKSIRKLPWEKEKIGRGLSWKYVHTDQLFDARQFISILMIGKNRTFSLGFEPSALKVTSQFSAGAGALAAINGGFFNMKEGGSVTFLKVDDVVINTNTHENVMITRHCLALDERGRLEIIRSGDPGLLADPAHFDDVLFTGPLLLFEGEFWLKDIPAKDIRHPRTCACTLKNGKTLLVTVDGRNEEAQGMTLTELANLMKGLKCYHAINLDGGGSTTMWIREKGVVNHPSDNGKFDAEGERKVANVLLVH